MKKIACDRKDTWEACLAARNDGDCPAGIKKTDVFPALYCPYYTNRKDRYYFVPTPENKLMGLQ